MSVTPVSTQPCWEIDNDPWEDEHFDSERKATAKAAADAEEGERRPNPVHLLLRPCVYVRCDCCGYGYGEDEYGAPLHVDPLDLDGTTSLSGELRRIGDRWVCSGCQETAS
jgi:hypothetical protein